MSSGGERDSRAACPPGPTHGSCCRRIAMPVRGGGDSHAACRPTLVQRGRNRRFVPMIRGRGDSRAACRPCIAGAGRCRRIAPTGRDEKIGPNLRARGEYELRMTTWLRMIATHRRRDEESSKRASEPDQEGGSLQQANCSKNPSTRVQEARVEREMRGGSQDGSCPRAGGEQRVVIQRAEWRRWMERQPRRQPHRSKTLDEED